MSIALNVSHLIRRVAAFFTQAAIVACLVMASLQGVQARTNAAPSDAFYQPPQPLPSAAHGTVIRTIALRDAAALPSAARNLAVLYHSRSIEGRDIVVSGTIAIPRGTAPAGGWPVTTWTHGTTGIGPACTPSRDTVTGPEHQFLAIHDVLMDAYVKRGYVVLATDYEGLGPPGGLHPFLQGVSEGRGALDIIRAARAIDPHIGRRYVVIGHSQGGQADLFTAAIAPQYVPELHALGNVAMAPASHIAATIQAMMTATQPSYALGYTMDVLESFASNHPAIDLTKTLTTEARSHLAETVQKCITATVSTGYWSTAIPKEQFLPGADLTPLLSVAGANEPATLHISAPSLIVQGTTDDTVMPSWTDAVVRALCGKGDTVKYIIYPGATHETIVDRSKMDVQGWVDARFAGATAQSNCSALPSAGGHG